MTVAEQSLPLVPRLFPEVMSGEKRSSIRWREGPIRPGPLTFFNKADPTRTAEVEVLRCTQMPLSEAVAFLGRAAEWPEPVMLAGMREHYP